ncbi:nucleotidyltransferase family protein [Dyella jiangningensis]|uniref:nucleotidyltransferase family protein n=1 Tax=Dyella jiangningensis TaxID=1379159 RepID=UPI00240F335B|nr:nucleotidyltransferase family protein [Dyella jiangningensis]MDG2538981.1 nucleotidyltransferase family protein [Dyella jiangningensis]
MKTSSAIVGAVLLAAGAATRFGSPKQLLEIDGEAMVRRMAKAALAAGLSPVIVVTGAHHDAVVVNLDGLDVQTVEHGGWAGGMGGSLAAGVRALRERAPRAASLMVLLGDQPSVGAPELACMLQAHACQPDRILAARYGGQLGPPCLFPRSAFDDLAALQGMHGARALLQKAGERVDAFDLPAAAFDIDTPADHAAWLAMQRHDFEVR